MNIALERGTGVPFFRAMIKRILIGIGDTGFGDDALGDLEYAGLPKDVEVEIFCPGDQSVSRAKEGVEAANEHGHSTDQLHPRHVRSQPVSSARLILNRARSSRPDLIVLLEENSNRDGHEEIDDWSQEILLGSECSVRIARPRPRSRRAWPPVIIIGYDGSPGGRLALDAVLARTWPANTEVRLVVVTDSAVLNSIGRFSPQMANPGVEAKVASQWASTLAEAPLERLREAGLVAKLCVRSGCPKKVLIDVARSLKADAIFLGPHYLKNATQEVTLGSVSAGVAAGAHCSVEVVRDRAAA